MDVAARDLGLLFRSRHPLVVCETVEEKRFESLVRAVAADLDLPVSTWSAASGLSPCHPTDQEKTADLARGAADHPGHAAASGVWLLKDPRAYLDNPATLRMLRETSQEFEGSERTIVLVGPTMPAHPRSSRIWPSASSSTFRVPTSCGTS